MEAEYCSECEEGASGKKWCLSYESIVELSVGRSPSTIGLGFQSAIVSFKQVALLKVAGTDSKTAILTMSGVAANCGEATILTDAIVQVVWIKTRW